MTQFRTFLRPASPGTDAAGPGSTQGAGGTPPGPDLPPEPTGRPEPAINGPSPRPAPPARRVGWAVCGLGHFAQNYGIPSIVAGTESKLTGLVSGSPEKLRAVGEAWGVPESARHGYDMRGLAENDAVEVVYVVTPNAVHESNVVAAFEAGKHVICEKPFAPTPEACQRMIDAGRAADRKLMIAYRAHFEPHNVRLKELLDAGELGRIEFASSDHHRPLDPSVTHDEWRMRRAVAGGGSLPDIGIYGLNGLIWLLGESPRRLVAQTHAPAFEDGRFAEVEAICNVLLEFPSGARAQISSGYLASKKRIDLWGSKAVAVLDPATAYAGNTLTVGWNDGPQRIDTAMPSEQQFIGEFDHFSRAVRDGTPIRTPGEMGLRDVRLIQAIYASAERGAWVEVHPDGTLAA